MTNRERFICTLKCERIGGQVPTFELVFFLTMEAFGRVHFSQRIYHQWNQMTYSEQKAQVHDMADLYIQTAKHYGHSAIFVRPSMQPGMKDLELTQWIMEEIREMSGDEYYLMIHGDPTYPIPEGSWMTNFAARMYEEPDKLNEESRKRVDNQLEIAYEFNRRGHLLDGFALCSDYCFNTNPFYSPEQFDELIAPYLKGVIDGYHSMGYYVIKHTDGNIMPIVKQIAACGPDAIHSLDPQGGVSIPEVRELIGNDVCLIGNVNCGLLQTGTLEECDTDIMRALHEGMANERGYVFATSNCVYTGMPLERYEHMNAMWRKYGRYDF